MLLRAFAVWLVIIVVETIHGIIRTLFIAPAVGDFRSRQIGVFVGSFLILGVAYALICWLQTSSTKAKLLVGLFWVVLTVTFEVGLGRLLGLSSDRLLEDYDVLNGGLMPFGLLFLFFSPLLASRLRNCT